VPRSTIAVPNSIGPDPFDALLMTGIGKVGGKALKKHQEQNHSTPAVSPGKIENAVQGPVVPNSEDIMNEAGQLGGELFPADKIPGLAKFLDRRGIYVHEAVNGSFDGVRGDSR